MQGLIYMEQVSSTFKIRHIIRNESFITTMATYELAVSILMETKWLERAYIFLRFTITYHSQECGRSLFVLVFEERLERFWNSITMRPWMFHCVIMATAEVKQYMFSPSCAV